MPSHHDEEEEEGDHHRDLLPIEGHFTCLGSARKKRPHWIVEPVMTSGLTIVIGPPKDSFKTTMAMGFALLIARQEHHVLPKHWVAKTHGPVLVFEAEADAGELKEMCEDGMGLKVPADESIMVADRPEEFRLDDEDAAEQMIHWCEERDVAACIMDPLVNFHELDEKDASAMVKILRPLRRWAKDNNTAFILLHHTRKIEDGKTYTANDARGTSAIFGLCDNILTITPGKEPYEILVNRRGKKGKSFEEVMMLNVWDRIGKKSSRSLRSLEKLVIRSIMHGFVTSAAIAQDTAIAEKTIKNTISYLVTAGDVKLDRKGLSMLVKYKPQELK